MCCRWCSPPVRRCGVGARAGAGRLLPRRARQPDRDLRVPGLYGFFTGMQTVTFSFLVSKVVPVEKRGAVGGSATRWRIWSRVAPACSAAIWSAQRPRQRLRQCVPGGVRARGVRVGGDAAGARAAVARGQAALPAAQRVREVPALMRQDADYRGIRAARAVGAAGAWRCRSTSSSRAKQAVLPVETSATRRSRISPARAART